MYISTYEQNRTIWMDGRPHPPDAAVHTWMGFSTGKWDGNTLTVYTTHMKAGYLRRNGLPESDQATLIEHFMRHGDYLVHVSEVTDPSTLTEPFVRTQVFHRIKEEGQNWLYPCESVVEIANQPRGAVPNFLPGENPFVTEFAKKYRLPLAATLGRRGDDVSGVSAEDERAGSAGEVGRLPKAVFLIPLKCAAEATRL